MLAIILMGGIVALVWSLLALRYGGLLAGCLAVILVGSCFGHPFFHVSAGPFPLTFDRLLLAGLVLVAVAGCRTGLVDPKPITFADGVLGLFFTVLVASTVTHNWRIDDSQPAATLLFFYGLPLAVYGVARHSRLDPRRQRMAFGFFALFGLYLAATAIAEKAQLYQFVFPRYIASPSFEEFFGRARGPFLNPVGCGLYLSCGFVATLFAWPRSGAFGRGLVLGAAGLIAAGVYCTMTRSVWLGLAISLMMVMLLSVSRRWRIPLFLAVVVLGAGLLVAKGSSLAAFKRDKHVSVHEMSESARLRPILATVAWRMFQDRPLWGHGFGQYKHVDVDYWRDPTTNLPLEKAKPYVQHNIFLALLTETGLIGMSLYMLLLCLWARSAWQVWSDPRRALPQRQLGLLTLVVLVSHVTNGMFHDVSIIPMSNMLLLLFAGACQGVAARPVNAESPQPVTRSTAFLPPLDRDGEWVAGC